MPPSSPRPNTILASTSPLTVVLVEPRIPQNTGNIARLCQCAGVELVLVGDLGFRMGDKYLKRAGMDYLEGLEIQHLPDFDALEAEKPGWSPYYLSTKAERSYLDVEYAPQTMLVFGSEDRGLPEWVIAENPENSIRIPMVDGARSLNLSNAVAIVLYEALRQMIRVGAR